MDITDLAKHSDAAAACNRCGFCTSFCPTYKATGNEAMSPRGRNQLVRAIIEGKLEDPAQAAEAIDTCLLCGECTSVCFSEVPTAKLMIAARHHLNDLRGVPRPLSFVLRRILPHPKRLRALLRIAFFAKAMGLSALARKSGLLRRFPALAAADEQLPRVPLRFLLDHALARNRAVAAKVAFMPACGEQYARPSTGLATLRLLDRLKIPVAIPPVLCCGLPAASYGVLESVRDFAKENIVRLEQGGYDTILLDDSSCGSHVRDWPSYFEDDAAWRERGEKLVARVRDVTEFLLERGFTDVLARSRWTGGPVAFHDPCKSQYAMKLTRPPRELMAAVPGLTVVPVADADQCCGGAGTFAVVHAELSRQVVAAKAAHVRSSGCTILVTSSVSCLIQLAAGLRRSGSGAEVLHIVEFLDRVVGTQGGSAS